MKARIEDKGKIGIYCIFNKINFKFYIGKSINIYKRIVSHISCLNQRKLKGDNQYFINAWHKYKDINFDYVVLEYLENTNDLVNRELFWMIEYKSIDSRFGYNLRMDSSTNSFTHIKTRTKRSINAINRFKDPKERDKVSKQMKDFWTNNPEIKKSCQIQCSKTRTKYKILQYDKLTKILIKEWNSVMEIMEANPSYKRSNINSVLQNNKPSIYGFIWKYNK